MGEWIEHDGAGCPVDWNTIVCIRVRDGQETPDHWMTPASDWNWRWTDGRAPDPLKSGDILAYRIIEPHEPAPSQATGS